MNEKKWSAKFAYAALLMILLSHFTDEIDLPSYMEFYILMIWTCIAFVLLLIGIVLGIAEGIDGVVKQGISYKIRAWSGLIVNLVVIYLCIVIYNYIGT